MDASAPPSGVSAAAASAGRPRRRRGARLGPVSSLRSAAGMLGRAVASPGADDSAGALRPAAVLRPAEVLRPVGGGVSTGGATKSSAVAGTGGRRPRRELPDAGSATSAPASWPADPAFPSAMPGWAPDAPAPGWASEPAVPGWASSAFDAAAGCRRRVGRRAADVVSASAGPGAALVSATPGSLLSIRAISSSGDPGRIRSSHTGTPKRWCDAGDSPEQREPSKSGKLRQVDGTPVTPSPRSTASGSTISLCAVRVP